MSTTALFVELLVVGLEALFWITLLIGTFFGTDWVSFVGVAFEKASLFTTVVLIGAAYLIGIIVDEVSDTLTGWWSRRIRHSMQEKDWPRMWDMQAYIFGHSKEATEQLGYVRSRVRIIRASVLNLALIGVFAIVFISNQVSIAGDLKIKLTWFVGGASVIMVGLAIFVFWRIEEAYWLRTRAIYKSLKEPAPQSSTTTHERSKKSKT